MIGRVYLEKTLTIKQNQYSIIAQTEKSMINCNLKSYSPRAIVSSKLRLSNIESFNTLDALYLIIDEDILENE